MVKVGEEGPGAILAARSIYIAQKGMFGGAPSTSEIADLPEMDEAGAWYRGPPPLSWTKHCPHRRGERKRAFLYWIRVKA